LSGFNLAELCSGWRGKKALILVQELGDSECGDSAMKQTSVQPSYRSSRVRRWVAYLWREAIRESWRPVAPAFAKPNPAEWDDARVTAARLGQSFGTDRESGQSNPDAREKNGIGKNFNAEEIDEHSNSTSCQRSTLSFCRTRTLII
jgi:hypothetical protein